MFFEQCLAQAFYIATTPLQHKLSMLNLFYSSYNARLMKETYLFDSHNTVSCVVISQLQMARLSQQAQKHGDMEAYLSPGNHFMCPVFITASWQGYKRVSEDGWHDQERGTPFRPFTFTLIC